MDRFPLRRLACLRRLLHRRNPLFDADWYANQYPDIALAGYDPYEHWIRHGIAERRDPNPYFRTEWYLRNSPEVARAGSNPLDHYLRHGAAQGLDPSIAFDSDWYLAEYPDVQASGMNPLLHYLTSGRAAGRRPRANAAGGDAPDNVQPASASRTNSPSDRITLDPSRRTLVLIDQHVPEYDRSAGGLAMWQYARLLREELNVVYVAHDGLLAEPYTSGLREAGVSVVSGAAAQAWFAGRQASADWVIAARPNVAPGYEQLVRRTTKARFLYFTVDLHFLREQRRSGLNGGGPLPRHVVRLRGEELAICRSADAVITPSSYEAGLLRQLIPDVVVHVVPLLAFDPAALPSADSLSFEHRDAVLFVGNYRHQPNVDAAAFLVGEIMPLVWAQRPDQRVILAGDSPTPEIEALAGPRVEITGYLPKLGPVYAHARVSLIPIRFGAGVKGKILESLAAGVPVVTTPVGDEGIGLAARQAGIVASDPEALAHATLDVISRDDVARRLASAGLRLVVQDYSQVSVRIALSAALSGSSGATQPPPIKSAGGPPAIGVKAR